MRAGPALSMAALLASVLTACGTTVPSSQRGPGAAEGLGDATSTPSLPPSATAGTDTVSTPVAAPRPGTVIGGTSTGVVAYEPGSSPVGATKVTDGLTGLPGITGRTATIGFESAGNAAAARAAFGLPNPQAPAIGEALRVLFDHVNKHGGFGGRRGEYVIHETDVLEGNWETQSQAACSALTEDHKVIAAVTSIARTPTIFNCLARHRTVGVAYYPGLAIPLPMWDGLADYLYGPVYLAYPRSSFLVDTWIRLGLLSKKSRVGLISIDEPTRQKYAEAIRQGLKRHGIPLTDEFKASDGSQVSDLGRAGQEMSSAVVQFRARNVDVVLFANTAGGGPTLFMPAAEKQQYYPRYGLSSYEFLRTLVTLVPKEALQRSTGVGWLPEFDLTDPRFLPKNPERTKCLKIFRDGGIQVTGKTEITINELCQAVFLIRDGMNAVHAGTARSFRQGVEGLGRYPTANSDPLFFAPGRRHDAVGYYRDLRFNTDCTCFTYTKGPFPIP
jgi:hypothetical protein